MNCCWPPVRQKSPVSRPDTGWMQEQLELEVAASRFWPKDWIQTPPRGSEQVYMVPQCTDRLQPSLSWMNHICVQSAGRYVTPNANTGVRGLNEDLFSGYLNVFLFFFIRPGWKMKCSWWDVRVNHSNVSNMFVIMSLCFGQLAQL